MQEWLHAMLAKLSKKSVVASAINYALGRWDDLLRFREDGRIEIDNNAAKRALHAAAIGRKNYLFAGADSGGECAAAIYSLIGSADLKRTRSRGVAASRASTCRRPSDQPHC
jgi:transposase